MINENNIMREILKVGEEAKLYYLEQR